ncbi:MAG: hypothetical protein V7K83_29600 [Nostoc sp.]
MRSYSTAWGQQLAICGCFVLLISHLNGNSETCNAKLPEPLNFNFFLEEKRAIPAVGYAYAPQNLPVV